MHRRGARIEDLRPNGEPGLVAGGLAGVRPGDGEAPVRQRRDRRNSSPTLVPSRSNTCARTAWSDVSAPVALMSVQATTKCPSRNAAMVGAYWSETVVVLTRNSLPALVPSPLKICARIAPWSVSLPLWLMSCHAATKRPSGRPAMVGAA